MKVFFVNTTKEIVGRHSDVGVKNYLVSYWYEKGSSIIDKTLELVPDAKIMLDSGAYTAYTQKETIDLNEYMEFITKYRSKIDTYINLDDIEDPDKSRANFDTMQKAGFTDVIPVFHFSEEMSYLKYYCSKSKYVAIGGATKLKLEPRKLANFIKNCLEVIPKDVKVHLLGMNNWNVILQFAARIESVDSSGTATRFNSLRSLSYSGIPISSGIDTTKGRMSLKHIQHSQYYTIFRILQIEEEINEFIKMKKDKKTLA